MIIERHEVKDDRHINMERHFWIVSCTSIPPDARAYCLFYYSGSHEQLRAKTAFHFCAHEKKAHKHIFPGNINTLTPQQVHQRGTIGKIWCSSQ